MCCIVFEDFFLGSYKSHYSAEEGVVPLKLVHLGLWVLLPHLLV